jgi:hypothetical protein
VVLACRVRLLSFPSAIPSRATLPSFLALDIQRLPRNLDVRGADMCIPDQTSNSTATSTEIRSSSWRTTIRCTVRAHHLIFASRPSVLFHSPLFLPPPTTHIVDISAHYYYWLHCTSWSLRQPLILSFTDENPPLGFTLAVYEIPQTIRSLWGHVKGV